MDTPGFQPWTRPTYPSPCLGSIREIPEIRGPLGSILWSPYCGKHVGLRECGGR